MKVGEVTCNARMMMEGMRTESKEYASCLSHSWYYCIHGKILSL